MSLELHEKKQNKITYLSKNLIGIKGMNWNTVILL